jgi:hypothetical protein
MAPPQTTKKQQICPRCTEVGTKPCSTCKNIKYCSAECEEADWPSHNSLCTSFTEFTEPRPSTKTRRVVVLLPGEPKPRFMWAPLTKNEINPSAFLDYSSKHLSWKYIEGDKNVWTRKQLGYVVRVWYDDNFLLNFEPSEPGSALFAAIQGQGTTSWGGPIVMSRETLPKEDLDDDEEDEKTPRTAKVLDMDMLAFSHATSMLIDHNGEIDRPLCKYKKLQCVELACGRQGESPEPHRVITLPRSHPWFSEEPELSEVSKV